MARKGFFQSEEQFSAGKNISALNASKKGYNALLALFGGTENLPSSVMRAKKARVTAAVDKLGTERSYKATAPVDEKLLNDHRLPKSLKTALKISGRGCQSGALSIFPQAIGRSIVLFYSNPGDTVFDPFAGHQSRMDLCVRAGRNYIGCDLCHEFMEFNRKYAKQLRKKYPNQTITLHEGDSRKVPVKSNSADFTITSPPYWDIEYYGPEKEQLGNSQTYDDFISSMEQVLRENVRVLKQGSYAAWFINDFRKKNKFYMYHMDLAKAGERAGFSLHDIMIVDLGRGFRDCFPNQTFESKIIPKRHEYGVVFKKP